MSNRSFKNFIEEELGTFPHFIIYAILEWIIIILLFIDGLFAFFSNQFAKFFNLRTPCLLCTRLDHVLVKTNPDFYYNDSICDSHKRNISSLAYCHVHKKLSEIKHMCEGCLLSFATEKESDVDTYKSLIGILHKDLELLIDEHELQLAFPVAGSKKDENFHRTNNKFQQQKHCSCCGEFLKIKTDDKPKNNNQSFFAGPSPSPRVSFNQRTLDLSNIKYSELPEEEDSVNTKGALGDTVDDRTPSFVKGGNNRFFGIDSALNSPRWSVRSMKKSLIDQNGSESEVLDGDSILHHLKRQVRLDRKSLMDLYMELDEERSASAVAANNAMAMITRLQAEKAAVQMEALQYQRMMDEQAEYDQEALQSMNGLLVKREEDIKELEAEIEAYRLRYGLLREEAEEFLDETKPVLDSPVCSPDQGEDLEHKKDSAVEPKANNGGIIEEEREDGSRRAVLVKEITEITERLSAIESKGELLQQISEVLDVSEGEAILYQISQNLHMLRSFIEMPSES
ncbi:putative myosin-binding protein 5 [Raphanus sativus]|uniref:Probable myosin-binding protein 5 isoform X1 n=1 Tax=Raphanus sativus TaxID=3726 RepID=A0A6J0L6T9_RAPSA|nr:probable myosin-binding protein 5 isoform X1 [Raphanus sativus]KAJ4916154.1 putative myosin-binding protein 5 [Raphanus sativus]